MQGHRRFCSKRRGSKRSRGKRQEEAFQAFLLELVYASLRFAQARRRIAAHVSMNDEKHLRLDPAPREDWNAAAMRRAFIWGACLLLAACSGGMPKLFWDVDEGKDQPAYMRGANTAKGAPARPPLDVPPVLVDKIQLPHPEAIGASEGAPLPARYRRYITGKAVRLDARFYPVAPAELFSATVDAMTALGLPVEAVDSASGVITTDWVRKGRISSVILFGSGSKLVRYRFLARIYRAHAKSGEQGALLELRTVGQVYDPSSGRWKRARIRRKPVRELFGAIEERLNMPAPGQASTPQAAR